MNKKQILILNIILVFVLTSTMIKGQELITIENIDTLPGITSHEEEMLYITTSEGQKTVRGYNPDTLEKSNKFTINASLIYNFLFSAYTNTYSVIAEDLILKTYSISGAYVEDISLSPLSLEEIEGFRYIYQINSSTILALSWNGIGYFFSENYELKSTQTVIKEPTGEGVNGVPTAVTNAYYQDMKLFILLGNGTILKYNQGTLELEGRINLTGKTLFTVFTGITVIDNILYIAFVEPLKTYIRTYSFDLLNNALDSDKTEIDINDLVEEDNNNDNNPIYWYLFGGAIVIILSLTIIYLKVYRNRQKE